MKYLLGVLGLISLLLVVGCDGGGSTIVPPEELAEISLSTSSLNFGQDEQRWFTIANSGEGTLEWSITCSDYWLSTSRTSGTTTTETEIIRVEVDRDNMSIGSYRGSITIISNAGEDRVISVSVIIIAPQPELSLSHSSLTLNYLDESTFTITNSGGGILEWEITCDADWLSCSPNSGVTELETEVITVTIDRGTLYAGPYAGRITIDPNEGISQEILVLMNVEVPEPIGMWDVSNMVLEEDYYHPMPSSYRAPMDGTIQVAFDLHSWPGHYGLEIMVMSSANYTNYVNGNNYSAYHTSVFTTGISTLETGIIEAGERFIVLIENTDAGWEDNDFDFIEDSAYYDVVAVFQGY